MNSLEQKIKTLIQQSDKYHYLLDFEEEAFTQHHLRLAIELAREAFIAGGMYSTFKGFPGLEDTPDFETWLKSKL